MMLQGYFTRFFGFFSLDFDKQKPMTNFIIGKFSKMAFWALYSCVKKISCNRPVCTGLVSTAQY
jgi:hypothetical protein